MRLRRFHFFFFFANLPVLHAGGPPSVAVMSNTDAQAEGGEENLGIHIVDSTKIARNGEPAAKRQRLSSLY